MSDPRADSPRRYFVDESGRRILFGLTIEETFEFESLDNLSGLGENGSDGGGCVSGIPTTKQEKRWLELYSKHDTAFRRWMVETHADRYRNLSFY
jgi:hypothetical protein